MPFNIVDRRGASTDRDKSSGSRQKFFNRNKRAIRDAINDAIGGSGGFTNIGKGGQGINVDAGGIEEPTFNNASGGPSDVVISGNDKYSRGDQIGKDPKGRGRGRGAGNGENEEEEFNFQLDRKEFLEILFEDLELPDMIKESLLNMNATERVPDGFVSQGSPSMLDKIHTFRNSLGRRIGLKRKPLREEIARLVEELVQLQLTISEKEAEGTEVLTTLYEKRIELQTKIAKLTKKVKKIPFIDPMDLRYRHQKDEPKPTTSAVMIALMDVSASMGDHEKTVAKLFFWLLHLFLTKQYEKIEVVFVRHTTEAKEVNEEEFFYSRETGGTYVKSGLDLIVKIIKDRYDLAHWNVYIAQASDGDAWGEDANDCYKLLTTTLLPMVQYMVYIQISNAEYGDDVNDEPENELWEMYRLLQMENDNFAMRHVAERNDIYPVFRKLFEKKLNKAA